MSKREHSEKNNRMIFKLLRLPSERERRVFRDMVGSEDKIDQEYVFFRASSKSETTHSETEDARLE